MVVIKQNGSFQLRIPKNFICEHCLGAFRSSYHLKRHLLIHTGNPPRKNTPLPEKPHLPQPKDTPPPKNASPGVMGFLLKRLLIHTSNPPPQKYHPPPQKKPQPPPAKKTPTPLQKKPPGSNGGVGSRPSSTSSCTQYPPK